MKTYLIQQEEEKLTFFPKEIRWRALFSLVFVGGFFFSSYGFTNWYADQLPEVRTLMFSWEQHIPFLPWMIIPYWSIDFFYALAFLFCQNKKELNRLVKRLVLVQIVAVCCFLLFPLKLAFEKPVLTGFYGTLFDLLASFDKPYNLAPSLHIALLIVLWDFYSEKTRRIWSYLVSFWAVLIGISVLTTFQHHFIDVPTGVYLGCFTLWAIPKRSFPRLRHITRDKKKMMLSFCYFLGSLIFLNFVFFSSLGILFKSILTWTSFSLFLVSCNYFNDDVYGFMKNLKTGNVSVIGWVLFTPYFMAVWLNAYLWTRGNRVPVEIIDGIWSGPLPLFKRRVKGKDCFLIDMSAEFPLFLQQQNSYLCSPHLDLTLITEDQLLHSMRLLEDQRQNNDIWIACALGMSRSVTLIITWLIARGYVQNIEEALLLFAKHKRKVVLTSIQRQVISNVSKQYSTL